MSAEALAALLEGGAGPLPLDVRWRLGTTAAELRAEYLAGHLPGAPLVDLDADLADPPGPRGRHPLPDPERFGAAMRRLGVGATRPVVVYDDGAGLTAARAWWLLRHHGHRDVRLLDGGLHAWRDAGLPLEAGPVEPPPGDFTPSPGVLPVLDAPAAARLARGGVLLDARAAERYRGEVEPVDPVAGHIPGAVSAPTVENAGTSGRFLDAGVLRSRFATLGAVGGAVVGVYCGSGVNAAHEVLALALAGVDAALYPGSWSEWVADPARAVATGPAPG